jgi:hypothetical protein
MSKQRTSYPFRPTPELRDRLERCARENNRSLNAELIERLEASFLEKKDSAALVIQNNLMLKKLCVQSGIDIESAED